MWAQLPLCCTSGYTPPLSSSSLLSDCCKVPPSLLLLCSLLEFPDFVSADFTLIALAFPLLYVYNVFKALQPVSLCKRELQSGRTVVDFDFVFFIVSAQSDALIINKDQSILLLPSLLWISRSLHSKLRLGSSSSSSLTDLSQTRTPGGGGGDKISGGSADDCIKDKGTQQRRAGSNATWNRLVCEPHLNLNGCVCVVSSLAVPLIKPLPFCTHTRRHSSSISECLSSLQGPSRSLYNACPSLAPLFIPFRLVEPFLLPLLYLSCWFLHRVESRGSRLKP